MIKKISEMTAEERDRMIVKRFNNEEGMMWALSESRRKEIIKHQLAGVSMSYWEDGKVKYIQAEDLVVPRKVPCPIDLDEEDI